MQSRAVATGFESDDRPACSSDPPAEQTLRSRRRRQVSAGPQELECPFDFEKLESSSGDQDSQVLTLLEMFGRETAADLAALDAAFKSQDADQITRLSHRMKGSAALLGAESLRKKASMMESRGRRADLSGAHAYLEGLIREYDRCRDFIDGLQASHSY